MLNCQRFRKISSVKWLFFFFNSTSKLNYKIKSLCFFTTYLCFPDRIWIVEPTSKIVRPIENYYIIVLFDPRGASWMDGCVHTSKKKNLFFRV